MGPAAAGYRGRAAEIMAQARGLLGAVDDLDTAARIETPPLRASRRARSTRSPCSAGCTNPTQRVAGQRGARHRRWRSPTACRRPGSSRPRPSACSPACSPGRSASPAKARRSRAALTGPLAATGLDPPRGRPARRRSPASTKRPCSIPATAPTATGPARRRSASASRSGWCATSPRRSAARLAIGAGRLHARPARRRAGRARRRSGAKAGGLTCRCRARASPCHLPREGL